MSDLPPDNTPVPYLMVGPVYTPDGIIWVREVSESADGVSHGVEITEAEARRLLSELRSRASS